MVVAGERLWRVVAVDRSLDLEGIASAPFSPFSAVSHQSSHSTILSNVTHLIITLHPGNKMPRRITQLLKIVRNISMLSIGLIIVDDLALSFTLTLLRLFWRGLDIDVLEATLVCDLALLAVITGPFAVALDVC